MNTELTLSQFIQQTQVDVPQNFMDMYLENKQLNGMWIHSELAFEWLKDEYSRYDVLTTAVKRYPQDMWKICKQSYKKTGPFQDGALQNGGQNKKFYLISSELYKALAMKNITKRLYYVKLEQIVNQYEDYQRIQIQNKMQQQQELLEQQQSQLESVQQQLDEYEQLKKIGTIYEIYNIDDENENYYGSHQNQIIEERWSTHVNAAITSLKLPLYRAIFRKGLQYFNQRLVTETEYITVDQLQEFEKKLIEQDKPSLNSGIISRACQKCGSTFKRINQHKCKQV